MRAVSHIITNKGPETSGDFPRPAARRIDAECTDNQLLFELLEVVVLLAVFDS
jgi:hypothetical protein